MRQTAIYIDNRIDHIVDFEKKDIVRTYVVSGNNLNIQELVRFYTTDADHRDVIFQTNSAASAVNVSIVSQETVKTGDNEFEINAVLRFTPVDPTGKSEPSAPITVPEQGTPYLTLNLDDPERKRLSLSLDLNRAESDRTKVAVNLTFTTPDPTAGHSDYESRLKLYFAPKPSIYDVVIDFGSEASQIIAASRSEEMMRSHRRKVLDDMRDVVGKTLAGSGLVENMLCAVGAQDGMRVACRGNGRDKYDQAEESDPTLYKSVFYVKSSIEDIDEAVEKYPVSPRYHNPAYVDTASNILHILTTKEESNSMLAFNTDTNRPDFIRLPNIKLAQFGGVALPTIEVMEGPRTEEVPVNDFHDNYFYRASLNHFILSALKGLKEKVSAVSVHILMPNVYDHFGVTKNLADIRRDIEDIITNNPTCEWKGKEYDLLRHLKAVEVDMMFESDASFLGLMTKLNSEINNHSLRDGNYLILDAGKGTLDYSVVNLIGREFINICHGGIIGAGNALTTAYIFALFNDYVTLTTRTQNLSLEDLIELLYIKVLGASNHFDNLNWNKNLANINEMVAAVEAYKAACNGNYEVIPPRKPANTDRGIDDLSLEEFISHVRGKIEGRYLQSLTDQAQAYVDTVVDKICTDVAENIELTCGKIFDRINSMDFGHGRGDKIGIDHAIFVGRGFLHKPLKAKMIEALREKDMCGAIEERTIDEALFNTSHDKMMKEVCLYVARMLNNGKYSNINTLITTDGIISADELNEDAKAAKTEDNRNWYEKFLDLFGSMGSTARKSAESTAKTASFIRIFANPGWRVAASQVIGPQQSSQMAEGYRVNKHQDDTHIIIGGNKYEFPRGTENGAYRLFFSADDTIYLRPEKNGVLNTLERRAVNLSNSSLAIPTLFPYINNINYATDFRDTFLRMLTPAPKPEPEVAHAEEKAAEEKPQPAKKAEEKKEEKKKDENKKDEKIRKIGDNLSEL